MILEACVAIAMTVCGQADRGDDTIVDDDRPFATIGKPKEFRDWGWYPVSYNGMTFPVWGYHLTPKIVRWNHKLPENIEQLKGATAIASELSTRDSRGKDDARKDQNGMGNDPATGDGALKPSPGAPDADSVSKLSNGRSAFNYGLDPKMMTRDNGPEVYRVNSIEGRRFVDRDSKTDSDADTRMHVTIIGSPEQRKQVMQDLRSYAQLVPLSKQLLVQEYSPGDWAVDPSLGFNNSGAPAILVQRHDGRVVAKFQNYEAGPDALVSVLRKADPNYDPSKDQDPKKPDAPSLGGINPDYLIGAGLIAAILFLPNKKRV